MKILLTIHEIFNPDSGSAGSTFKLGQEYQKLGHEVSYYSFDDLPHWLPRPTKRVIFPEFVASKIMRHSDQQATYFDVVDASTGDAWLWGKFLQGFTKKTPVLVTRSHGLQHLQRLELLEKTNRDDKQKSLSWKYKLYRGSIQLWEVATSLRCADLVFLLNQSEKKYVTEQLGVDSEKVHIFPNGMPEPFLNLPFEPTPKEENVKIRIAQIGTYIPRKGIHYSVPALNRILARYPHVEVSFFGTECLMCPNVEKVYEDFDPEVRDRVKVVPRYRHETLPTLLKGYQIKLFPSISEGFGKALIEAMACGLAPITTATSGPLEIVKNDHDSIVVPTRDTEAIEQA
ncbi:MAG: glycosyltransferase family 4 protein, partial [Cyanobacteria bacterium J06592_8]